MLFICRGFFTVVWEQNIIVDFLVVWQMRLKETTDGGFSISGIPWDVKSFAVLNDNAVSFKLLTSGAWNAIFITGLFK